MSRGISKQQCRILGLGYTINKRWHSGEFRLADGRMVTPPTDGWKIPALYSTDVIEVTAKACLAFLNDFDPTSALQTGWFENTPELRIAKASVTRAITSMLKRGLLIYRPSIRYWEKARGEALRWHGARKSVEDHLAMQWGYVLTEEGARVGSTHERDTSDNDLFSTLAKLWREYRNSRVDAHVAECLRRAALAEAA